MSKIIRKCLALGALALFSSGSAVFAALFYCIAATSFGGNAIFVLLNVGAAFIFSAFVIGSWACIMYVKDRW